MYSVVRELYVKVMSDCVVQATETEVGENQDRLRKDRSFSHQGLQLFLSSVKRFFLSFEENLE